MDMPRGTSTGLPPPRIVFHSENPQRPFRNKSQTLCPDLDLRPSKSMAIPGSQTEDIPPPLPPPRYIRDLDNGLDIAWSWQNENLSHRDGTLAPIKPGSSLLGDRSRAQYPNEEDEDIEMDMDGAISSLNSPRDRQPSQPWLLAATATHSPSTRPSSYSGMSQRLHGERPLSQQNHNQSTHAYDKHMLMKIGKSHSPPNPQQQASTGNRITTTNCRKLSLQTKCVPSMNQVALTTSPCTDSSTRWVTSPISGVSPSTKFSWPVYDMDACSPASEASHQQCLVEAESALGSAASARIARTHLASDLSTEEFRSRSERGSYDSIATPTDTDFTNDDTGFAFLHALAKPRTAILSGTKRRAVSAALSEVIEQRAEYKNHRSQMSIVPQSRAPPNPNSGGSLSSTASSIHHNSYASSHFLSGASSATSMSSIDTQAARAPARVQSIESGPQSAANQTSMECHGANRDTITPDQSSQRESGNESSTLPTCIRMHLLCSCCPKKPRKFETQDQLRTHEGEKQYACAYCSNRFKNKNEAERHQNSLHLRRQSWSCAALKTYQAAYQSSSTSTTGLQELAYDICGFCGEEFTNYPPDWQIRIGHLMNLHRFGECNSSKKFFRADHFRQHLKHSHAGKTGRWTNILEGSCLREEPVIEPASPSPTASEHSQSGS